MNSTNTLESLDLHIQELEPMDVPDDWDERIKGISAGLALVGIAVAIT
ncbi:daptide-type RiPP [Paenarthrobacter sp. CCNWLY172]|nr:daptide-type RiPP [Arthrobacter sp. D5-1]